MFGNYVARMRLIVCMHGFELARLQGIPGALQPSVFWFSGSLRLCVSLSLFLYHSPSIMVFWSLARVFHALDSRSL